MEWDSIKSQECVNKGGDFAVQRWKLYNHHLPSLTQLEDLSEILVLFIDMKYNFCYHCQLFGCDRQRGSLHVLWPISY